MLSLRHMKPRLSRRGFFIYTKKSRLRKESAFFNDHSR
ncbi:hypothetical protein EFW57_02859 [Bacillus velezensis]|nr:hypothetical protein EFW57_02859 [Bacillus velezensis]